MSFTITVSFIDNNGDLYDPSLVYAEILDGPGTVIETPSVTNDSIGIYSVQWTPPGSGVYTARFTGDLVTLEQEFVIPDDQPDKEPLEMGHDFKMEFSSGFSPMYLDPEHVLPYVPEATALEVARVIHRYSLEVEAIFPGGTHPPLALDYIHAATLCHLSRVYEGIGGASSYSGFTLGDLQVMDTSGGASNRAKNRGNVSDWCELAELLRMQLRRGKGGFKTVVKGQFNGSPIPSRDIGRSERVPGHRKRSSHGHPYRRF